MCLVTGEVVEGVKLSAITTSPATSGFILIPSVGSNIILGTLSDTEAFVASYGNVDSIRLKSKNSEIRVDDSGVEMISISDDGNERGRYTIDGRGALMVAEAGSSKASYGAINGKLVFQKESGPVITNSLAKILNKVYTDMATTTVTVGTTPVPAVLNATAVAQAKANIDALFRA